jgi:hypothetical protein
VKIKGIEANLAEKGLQIAQKRHRRSREDRQTWQSAMSKTRSNLQISGRNLQFKGPTSPDVGSCWGLSKNCNALLMLVLHNRPIPTLNPGSKVSR